MMALGKSKKEIYLQFFVEALLIGCIGFVLSMGLTMQLYVNKTPKVRGNWCPFFLFIPK